jgi:arsenate reductase (thioredoxin)
MHLERFTNLDRAMRGEVDRLASEFRGVFSRESIEQAVAESLQAFGDVRITTHLPQLVYRYTKERMIAAARLEEKMTKDHPVVLFVCVHNAGRSQMAAAFTRELSEGRVEVRSAGSLPAHHINPTVVQAMQEIGIDLAQEYPKPIADEVVREADVVITMGCGDACPIYPGKKYEDWELDDPADQPLERVSQIRDDIRVRVEQLLVELGVTAQ